MKKFKSVVMYALFWIAIILIAVWFTPYTASSTNTETIYYPMYIYESKQVSQLEDADLSHAQTVWLYALEWCESRGIPEAVNPVDLDGTPSLGAWQFKPTTFWYYADKYNVSVPENQEAHLKREYQYEVVKQMLLHYDDINWNQQFPACVRKLGLPPR